MSKIQCPICNKELKEITNSHLRLHNLTISQFKSIYPNYSMLSDELRIKRNTSKYIDYSKVTMSITTTKNNNHNYLKSEYSSNPKICKQCANPLPYEKRKLTFCSRSCSSKYNSKHMSNNRKENISKGVKRYFKEHPEASLRWASYHTHNKHFSSKGEKELLNIIKNKFPNYNFTCGSLRKISNNTYKSLDIYSNELRLIIEFDGIYHFKNIYNNLESVQLKDRLLEQWCIDNDWKIIRVNEITFQHQKDKILITLFDMINNHQHIPNVSKLYWENY